MNGYAWLDASNSWTFHSGLQWYEPSSLSYYVARIAEREKSDKTYSILQQSSHDIQRGMFPLSPTYSVILGELGFSTSKENKLGQVISEALLSSAIV